MGTTANLALRYPEPTDLPDVQKDIKNLALDVDGAAGLPLGATADWPWAAASIPIWALLPYGQLLTQAAYPTLQTIADAAGRPYGGSAGVNFNLPDYRGRVGAGKDDMGGTAANRITSAISGVSGATLGAVFGSEGITLTTAQLPAHTHTFTTGTVSADHTHSISLNTGYISADHSHSLRRDDGAYCYTDDGSEAGSMIVSGGTARSARLWGTYGVSANHYHYLSGGTSGISANHTHSGTSDNTGSGSSVRCTQPTIIVNKFIRVV